MMPSLTCATETAMKIPYFFQSERRIWSRPKAETGSRWKPVLPAFGAKAADLYGKAIPRGILLPRLEPDRERINYLELQPRPVIANLTSLICSKPSRTSLLSATHSNPSKKANQSNQSLSFALLTEIEALASPWLRSLLPWRRLRGNRASQGRVRHRTRAATRATSCSANAWCSGWQVDCRLRTSGRATRRNSSWL
jgi:hypothetical protein